MSESPPFPAATFEDLVGLPLEQLQAIDVGAVYLLLRSAWRSSPPCSLPDEDGPLARVAGVGLTDWPAVRRRIQCTWLVQDARVVFARAHQVYTRDLQQLERRRRAGQIAAGQRWHGCDSDATRMRNACDSQGGSSLGSLSSSSAPAPERSKRALEESSARAELRIAQDSGARARALRTPDQERCLRILQRARFYFAERDRQEVPPPLAIELAEHPNATPMLLDYAVRQIIDIGTRAVTLGNRRPNPLGYLIAAVGAQKSRAGRPWEVPLFFAKAFQESEAKRAADEARTAEMQARLDAARARHGLAGPAREVGS